jgi:hypothetical protein
MEKCPRLLNPRPHNILKLLGLDFHVRDGATDDTDAMFSRNFARLFEFVGITRDENQRQVLSSLAT